MRMIPRSFVNPAFGTGILLATQVLMQDTSRPELFRKVREVTRIYTEDRGLCLTVVVDLYSVASRVGR